MSCTPNTEKLIDLVNDFRNGKLLLPDFQRKYTWTPKDDMRALLASFILDYPIGTFLIGEAQSNSFRAREPECFDKDKYMRKVSDNNAIVNKGSLSDSIESSDTYAAKYLYDGQQRLTTIEMLFGDGYFASPLDKNKRPRWFLNLYKFGLKELKWPDDITDVSFDELCSDMPGDSYIVSINYNKNSKKTDPLHPDNRLNQSLVDFCINDNDNGYLFPLDNLFDDDIDVVKTNILFMSIKEIVVKTDRYKEIKNRDLSEDELNDECNKIQQDIKKWISKFSLLINRIRDFQVPVININSQNLSRVAGIFEVVNKQGVDLKTFDLLLARSIKPNEETIRDSLQKIIRKSYLEQKDSKIFNLIQKSNLRESLNNNSIEWNPADFFGGSSNKINNGEILTNNLMSLYSKLLTLLSRFKRLNDEESYTPNSKIEGTNYNWSIAEREILKTDREDIFEIQDDASERLIRACIYVKMCCGVKKLSELAYKQMILVIALVLDDVNWNAIVDDNSCKINKRLQAWYWGSVFSGKYERSQDVMVLRDSLDILEFISTGQGGIYNRKNEIMKALGYSDLATIKNEPGKAISSYISQFELRNGVRDFYSKDKDGGEYSKGIICSFNDDVELDHILSIDVYCSKEASKINRNDSHPINSPLNKTNISKSANLRKSNKNLFEYYKMEKIKNDPQSEEAKILTEHFINKDLMMEIEGEVDFNSLLNKIIESRYSNLTTAIENLFSEV